MDEVYLASKVIDYRLYCIKSLPEYCV